MQLLGRAKRVAKLIKAVVEEAPTMETYACETAAPDAPSAPTVPHFRDGLGGGSSMDPAGASTSTAAYTVRDLKKLSPPSAQLLEALFSGCAAEAAIDAKLVEALHALNAYSSVMPAILARPPLSSAALRLVRVSMSQSQHVIDTGLELAVGTSLLQCREESDHSAELNANVRTTLLAQPARDDAAQVLGFVGNQQHFHAMVDEHEAAPVRRRGAGPDPPPATTPPTRPNQPNNQPASMQETQQINQPARHQASQQATRPTARPANNTAR